MIRDFDDFDALGRAGYSDRVPRRLLGTRSMLRHAEWREAVIRLLLDALYGSLTHAPVVPTPATR